MPSPTTFPFLRLAPELRLKIYDYYFFQTPINYPTFHSALIPLLLTCRQIYTEAIPLLHTSSHYIFPTARSLLTYLFSLSGPRLRLLRHVTVRGDPIPLYDPDDEPAFSSFFSFDFPGVLRLFPGLQLDTLTVWDAYHRPDVSNDGWGGGATCRELCDLVTRGKGWRTLVFRSHSDAWFSRHLPPAGRHGTVDQPAGWKASLLERDGGADSGCSLEMGVTNVGDLEAEKGYVPWDVNNVYDGYRNQRRGQDENNERRQRGEPNVSSREWLDRFTVGIEVRVQRGHGCDYVQDGVMETEWDKKLGKIFEKLSWKELQEQEYYVQGAEDDPCATL